MKIKLGHIKSKILGLNHFFKAVPHTQPVFSPVPSPIGRIFITEISGAECLLLPSIVDAPSIADADVCCFLRRLHPPISAPPSSDACFADACCFASASILRFQLLLPLSFDFTGAAVRTGRSSSLGCFSCFWRGDECEKDVD
ncbi:hypothetical protein LXL04_038474 [Taraxacum kok-saghyz]